MYIMCFVAVVVVVVAFRDDARVSTLVRSTHTHIARTTGGLRCCRCTVHTHKHVVL